jgi:hypothetical protein
MPEFWSFWNAARDRDPTTQVRLFETMIRAPHAEVYDAVLRGVNIPVEQLVPRSIEGARGAEPALRRLASQVTLDLPEQLLRFRREFPDFTCSTPVYFMYSVGTFDGATRTVAGKTALIFGLDVIARLHGERLTPLAVHELFHVHHQNLLPGSPGAFYWSMWREGLATHVSRRLNPTIAEQDACCLPPLEPIRAMMPRLVTGAIGLLDSTRRDDYARYFLGGVDQDIPVRSGYYLGYLVARDLGETRSLAELARMTPGVVRPLLEQALRRLR